MKQVFYNRGAGGGTRVASGHSPLGDENYESHFEHDGTKLQQFRCQLAGPSLWFSGSMLRPKRS